MNKISKYVQEIRRGDRFIFINPNIPRWIVTDKVGKLIISLFDGTMSTEEIVSTAVTAFGKDHRPVISDFCSRIVSSGLLDEVPPSPRKHKLSLSSVHLSLSDKCNLNCTYCYAKSRKERSHPFLTYEKYCSLIDEILSINPSVTFTLTGGEPLLNPNVFLIAEYIKKTGVKVFLLTNGLLISDSNIEKISTLFDLVTLSLDGPNDAVHSMTRGHNYDKVLNSVSLLEKHRVEYTLSMTVTSRNIDYVGEMASKFGSRLNFAPYFPVLKESDALSITGLEYYRALKSASGVKPLGYCESSLDNAMKSRCHKCAIGDGEFSISATGDVYPCQLLHTDEFYAGNVHENSITDIYTRSKVFKKCSGLDVDSISGCRECPIKYICGGSCRARSYYGCGDITSSTDFCEYEKEAFYDGIIAIYSRNCLLKALKAY